ncbi:MAG: ABC transporter permease [Propionibacteriaceae bacterium]|nr:ABC transporter permease [Propionibacteriaceae bacterium]
MIFFARSCIDGLRFNKLRVVFTGMGVLVGVTSVILIVVLADSFYAGLRSDNSAGFTVGLTSSAESNVDVVERIVEPDMTARLDAIRRRPDVASFEPSLRGRTLSAATPAGGRLDDLVVEFTDDVPVVEGAGFADSVGNSVIAYRNTEFDTALPLGSQLLIDGAGFTVVGLTDSLGANGNTRLFLPARLADVVDTEDVAVSSSYTLVAMRPEQLDEVRASVLAQLNDGIEADLRFVDFSAEETAALTEMFRTVGTFLALIASISLAVAALNIVNVMYIATLERADEIAIYRSLGMTRRGVQAIFLLESGVVVAAFAVLGCLLGNAIAFVILTFLDTPLVFSLGNLAVLLLVVVVVGIGGGLYPAYRAARIDPVRLLH